MYNRFIELIVSRCPGGQKDFQKGRDKDRDNGLNANCNKTTMLMLCLMLFPWATAALRDWTLRQMFLVLIQNCHFLSVFLYSETTRWLLLTITSLGSLCVFYSSRTTIGVLYAYKAQIGHKSWFLLPEWITCVINSYPKQLKILAFDYIFQ